MNEVIIESKMPRRRFFKGAARKMLFSDWVGQILAFIIIGAIYVGINQFGQSVASVIVLVTENVRLGALFVSLYFVFSFLLIMPLVYGLFNFEIKALENEKSRLSDLFFAFASLESINRTCNVFIKLILRVVVCFLPAIALGVFKSFYYYDGIFSYRITFGNTDVVAVLLNTLFVLLVYFGMVLSSKYILTVYISIVRTDLEAKDCFFLSKVCTYSSRHEIALTFLSFLPLFVVSLFTVGFLFILYLLPYMLITLTMMSKYFYEKEMSSGHIHNKFYTRNENEINPKGSI